jgi:hypothetical protein
MALLLGCSFADQEHFQALFSKWATASSKGSTDECKPTNHFNPGERYLRLMKRLLAPILVARPKSVLANDLPLIHQVETLVDFSEEKQLCGDISEDVRKGRWLIRN